MGRAGGLIIGGPGIIGMCPPIGRLIPRAGPLASSEEEEEDPSLAPWEGPPFEVLASYEGEVDPEVKRWDYDSYRRRSREWSRRYLSLLKCCSCFLNWALCLLFHPFLIVVFHNLFVFPTTEVCLSHRWRVMGEVCITVVSIRLRHVILQAVGHSAIVPPQMTLTSFSINFHHFHFSYSELLRITQT